MVDEHMSEEAEGESSRDKTLPLEEALGEAAEGGESTLSQNLNSKMPKLEAAKIENYLDWIVSHNFRGKRYQ